MKAQRLRLLSFPILLSLCTLISSASPAQAQCAGWVPGFGAPGLNGTVNDTLVWDDGSGPRIFVAGNFDSAGDVPAKGLAAWDGHQWTTVGSGLNGSGGALCIWDDGSGPALWVGGGFTSAGGVPSQNLARWNGSAWSSPGTGPEFAITCMTVHDDGTGPALFVGGYFHATAGMQTESIAKWDGAQWSPLALGVFGQVKALASFRVGPIAHLYVAGAFEAVGPFNVSAFNIARWDGGTWTLLDGGGPGFTGTSLQVNDLEVFDDGSGAKLYVCGAAQRMGPLLNTAIGAWDGTSWSAVSPSGNEPYSVNGLFVHDAGSGPRLFGAGRFRGTPSASTMARLEPQGWITYGTTSFGDPTNGIAVVAPTRICAYDDGTGEHFFAAGRFSRNGNAAMDNIARFEANHWAPLQTATPTQGVRAEVHALAEFDDGSGPAIYAAGHMCNAGTRTVLNIARWNGATWNEVGTGLGQFSNSDDVRALLAFDDGFGPALYAAGQFVLTQLPQNGFGDIARWNGTTWSLVGGGIGTSGVVNALAQWDDGTGTALYAAGVFSLFTNGQKRNIARWDGTSWSAVGGGIQSGTPSALAVYDDGHGSALYVAGTNLVAGSSAPCGLLRWDGVQWTAVAFGAGQRALQLAVFDDGTGADLYVGGFMTHTGTVPVSAIARFDGTTWSDVGGGLAIPGPGPLMIPSVRALDVVDTGAGPLLFVGGQFDTAGGARASGIAAWNGTAWTGLSTNVTTVMALAGGDPLGTGKKSLFVGGLFAAMGDQPAQNLAEWRGCTSGLSFCAGDGTAAACPCANFGTSGHGCANSVFASGSRLGALGTPSVTADTLTFTASPVPLGAGLFFQGDAHVAGGNGSPFGDGLVCVTGAIRRLAVVFASTDTAHLPIPTIDPAIHVLGATSVGDVRSYQFWFRDADPGFCSPARFNLTNALQLAWLP